MRLAGAVVGVALDLHHHALPHEEEVGPDPAAGRSQQLRLADGVQAGVVHPEAAHRLRGRGALRVGQREPPLGPCRVAIAAVAHDMTVAVAADDIAVAVAATSAVVAGEWVGC